MPQMIKKSWFISIFKFQATKIKILYFLEDNSISLHVKFHENALIFLNFYLRKLLIYDYFYL